MSSLASALAQILGGKFGADPSIMKRFSDLILPKRITGKIVGIYVRKAIRRGLWRSLRVEERALLLVARGFGIVRSRVLVEILRRIFVEIEIHTLRGRAILYGIIVALKTTIYSSEILSNKAGLLAIGISYLNNPPMYRYYG